MVQIKKYGTKSIFGLVSLSLFTLISETFGFGMNFTHALQKSILNNNNHKSTKQTNKPPSPPNNNLKILTINNV